LHKAGRKGHAYGGEEKERTGEGGETISGANENAKAWGDGGKRRYPGK